MSELINKVIDFCITGIAVLLIVLIVILIVAKIFEDKIYAEDLIIGYKVHRVRVSDTFTDLAKMSNFYGIYDTACIIEEIKSKSEVGDVLYPGDTVYIPIYNMEVFK